MTTMKDIFELAGVPMQEARLSKAKKKSEVTKIYNEYFSDVSVNIFDLSKINTAIERAIDDGNVEEVLPKLVKQYGE